MVIVLADVQPFKSVMVHTYVPALRPVAVLLLPLVLLATAGLQANV